MPAKKDPIPEKSVAPPVLHDRKAYIWLWTGVMIFSLAILTIWVINTKTFIENTPFGREDKTDLLQLGKQDLEKTLQLINKSDNSDDLLKEQKAQDEKARQSAETKRESANATSSTSTPQNEKTDKQLQNLIDLLNEESATTTATTTP